VSPRQAVGLVGVGASVLAVLATAGIAVMRWSSAFQEAEVQSLAIAGVSDVLLALTVLGAVAGAGFAAWGRGPGGRWWLLTPAMPLAVLVAVSWPTLVGLARPEDPAPGPTVTVVAQNLLKDNRHPEEAARVLLASGADVLWLSEVTPRLAEVLRRSGIDRAYPHRVVRARAGSDGTALYSRVPFTAGRQPSRYRTEVVLHLPGARPLDLVGVHLPSPTRAGIDRWERAYSDLRSLVARRGAEVVVAGDFNGGAPLVPFRVLASAGGLRDAQDVGGGGFRPTWSELTRIPPLLRLDHVLVRRGIGVASFDFVPDLGSDHRGVEATLRLRRLAG
jgi:endonuclease/exonuclease/phosphatase (EEP) superfamily protein YafD